ncbi:MAG TPA: acyl-CoA reductase [Ruminococcaceae bacterium]|nr:acyl-CoA reductase [Oscillospiraceae bacterium]
MIIAFGKTFPSNMQNEILFKMESRINRTLSQKPLNMQKVITAIDKLGKEIASGKYDEKINKLLIDNPLKYKDMAVRMLSREAVEAKLETELNGLSKDYGNVKAKIMPLGVIFHIAAGNVEGLPAYCVAEGLLTGNINILKLPQADNNLSVEIISRLIELEPDLSDYIYVFDTPSADIHGMRKMADLADGISVWGGDEAIMAVRRLAAPAAKLIEWGHKLGFVYISGMYHDSDLEGIAEHIAIMKQLLCSSCQVIYCDTEDIGDLHILGQRFLPILEKAVKSNLPNSIGTKANMTILGYTDMLENLISGNKNTGILKGKGCSIKVCGDSDLELSPMMCNVLIKKLPRKKIIPVLRKSKGYLQTAGLICSDSDKQDLCSVFFRCGVTKIVKPRDMSEMFLNEAHDGQYALSRYIKIVNEIF